MHKKLAREWLRNQERLERTDKKDYRKGEAQIRRSIAFQKRKLKNMGG